MNHWYCFFPFIFVGEQPFGDDRFFLKLCVRSFVEPFNPYRLLPIFIM